ncbi:hypothetical protein PInf_024148 [Phytophthora infestans]|nr:hypothetical protein PInf_024148 [Phytophthora infestans]
MFHWQGLLQLVQGREEFGQARADRSQEWMSCFETRERKAHTEIVLSLHGDLLDRFESHNENRGNRNDGQGVQRQVNTVSHHQGGNRQQHGGKRHHSGDTGQGSSKKKRSEEEASKRRAEIQERKHTAVCKSCHKRGHWWKECPDRKSTNREKIRTMAGSVLRRVKRRVWKIVAVLSFKMLSMNVVMPILVETHPLRINPERQRKDAHSYSTIYARHGLSALIDGDFEERLLRARDAQREDESIAYSPTSPLNDDDGDKREASGLPVVRRVQAATTNGDTGAVPADDIEWILDSGAQENVTGELQLFNNVMELQHAEFLEGATGSCERIGIAGAVLMPV